MRPKSTISQTIFFRVFLRRLEETKDSGKICWMVNCELWIVIHFYENRHKLPKFIQNQSKWQRICPEKWWLRADLKVMLQAVRGRAHACCLGSSYVRCLRPKKERRKLVECFSDYNEAIQARTFLTPKGVIVHGGWRKKRLWKQIRNLTNAFAVTLNPRWNFTPISQSAALLNATRWALILKFTTSPSRKMAFCFCQGSTQGHLYRKNWYTQRYAGYQFYEKLRNRKKERPFIAKVTYFAGGNNLASRIQLRQWRNCSGFVW